MNDLKNLMIMMLLWLGELLRILGKRNLSCIVIPNRR